MKARAMGSAVRRRHVLVQCLSLLVVYAAIAFAQDHPREKTGELRSHPETNGDGEGEGEAEGDLSPATVAAVVLTCLVGVSILFEQVTELLKESTDEMNMPFVNTIFSELTTLGFIGLVLFIVTKLDVLSSISARFLGEPGELQETIESLHMGLFLFIIIFLVLCVGLLRLGTLVQDEWREFERSCNDVPAVVTEYVLATEPPRTWRDKLSLSRFWAARKCKREMVYLALRRRFVDARSNHTNPDMAITMAREFQVNADVRFPFNEYLSLISGEVMARLIEIDLPTWVALEAFLLLLLVLCWSVGPDGEMFVLLVAGLSLILLNELVYSMIRGMRRQLTPPRLEKDAERLRRKNEWRANHQLPLYDSNEKTWILDGAETTEHDFAPPYLDTLANGGFDMTEGQLREAQRSMLFAGKNGVKLALFCTRLVFLLTALHLSVFLMRTAHQIYTTYSSWVAITVLYVMFLLPSVLVTGMSVTIARDGLYAFNVEHMKSNRTIARVMRILKARQTLRTLRFVAEMKIYLKENVRRKSSVVSPLPITATLHEASARFSKVASKKSSKNKTLASSPLSSSAPASSPTSPSSAEPKQSLTQARRRASASLQLTASEHSLVTPPLSPLAAYYLPRGKRSHNFKLEMERREINTIFCLFDTDGSGSVSRHEMASLLQAITDELDESQLSRLMSDLLAGQENQDEVTFESFYNWCHQHIQDCAHSKDELIEEIFRMVDTDDSGFITVDEFIAIFKTLGQSLDHDDVRELVYQMDRNDDGKIDLEEFSKMLQKHEV